MKNESGRSSVPSPGRSPYVGGPPGGYPLPGPPQPPMGIIPAPPPGHLGPPRYPMGQEQGFGSLFSGNYNNQFRMPERPDSLQNLGLPSVGPNNNSQNNLYGMGVRQLSMSPSHQMMRSNMHPGPITPVQQPPPASQPPPISQMQQRQLPSSSPWATNVPAGMMRQATGATTPQGAIDFRPQLPPTGITSDIQQVAPRPTLQPTYQLPDDGSQLTFSEEVQEEANTYFEQIYSPNKQLTIEAFLSKLKMFQSSSSQREREVLSCVVKNLFEEYRFFHEYPDRELMTTAEVYGGIIREGIITNLQFATAVRKVIESLQTDPTSRLYQFGIIALSACKKKLCCYPKVCAMIMQHENFPKFPPQLAAYVKAGVSEKLPPSNDRDTPTSSWPAAGSQGQASPQRNNSGDTTAQRVSFTHSGRSGPNFLSVTNADTLISAAEKEGVECEKPAEAVTDKVGFLFNNLSQSNLQAKTEEMRTLLSENGESFMRWLAQYIVIKRVAIEPNFQPLYNLFLQSLKDTTFDQFVKIETLRNIKVILRSDKREAATNYGDRSLLKNLGMWLGLITIARSTCILMQELDLKSLLLEAYYKGQEELLFVIPFVAKIVCSSSKSQVFSPYSSWIRGILKVFAELHTEPDLKINLKFEIEVLFKELNIDLQEMMHYVDDVLKDTDRLLSVKQQLSDLRTLQQPVITSSSPIPQAMRGTGTSGTPSLQEIGSSLGNNETKTSSFVQGPIDILNEPMEPMAAPPSYSYFDINVVSYEGITSHLKIPTHHPLFQMYPTLKGFVKPAVIQAIKELLGPVNDKALKTASTATEHLTKKDFALCGDDMQMRRAGINIMRAVTGAMVHVSIREPMQSTLASYLHQSLNNGLRNLCAQGDPKLVEEAVAVITVENLELAMDFVVKTACEKSAPELDRKMEVEYQLRQSIRREGKEFTGAEDLLIAQSMLPEALRIGAGPIPKEQMGAYEEYSTRICGFKPFASDEVLPVHPMVVKDNYASGISIDLRGQGESENFGKTFHFLSSECESFIARGSVFPSLSKVVQALMIFRDNLRQLAFEPSQPLVLRNTLVQAIEQFLNAYTPSSHSIKEEVEVINRLHELTIAFIRMLVMKIPLNDISARITNILTGSQGDYRFNFEAVEQLVRNHLILFEVYDRWLGEMIESGQNAFAPIFAQRLVRLVSSRGITEAQIREKFPLTFEQLLKLQSISGITRSATENQGGTGAQNSLIGIYFGDRVMQNPNLPITDAQGDGELQSKVEEILREWISLCYTPAALKDPQQALATIIHMMHEHGVLATDDMITRFFRLCTEMCVDVSYRLLKDETASNSQTIIRQRCYYTLDAFVKLTCLMVRFSDGSQAHTKVNLFRKVLNIVTSVLVLDHEVRRAEFHPMPYHRILIIMFIELTDVDDPSLEPIFGSIVDTFVNALFVVQPRRAPRFALAWLDLVGHRYTISRLIVPAYICSGAPTPDALNAAAMYTQLLICQLKFLSPYLRNIDLPKSIALLYRGTLRVLLVILHDFPELLCEFHFVLCDTIPPNCIQLRNLVLSAYPKHMKLPDPFTLNFKQIDALSEMMFEPKMNLSMTSVIPSELLQQLEGYLSTRIGVDLLSSLPTLLTVSHTAGSRYNTTILHAIVLYVGSRAVEVLQSKGQRISMTTIAHTSFMDIFQNLAVRLCTEGRYLLFNAIANQLRYPNAHTHYFSCTLLFLFFQADMNVMKEQITRVLFERLVALRPHPWGLLITFIELIRNPIYRFWEHDFTKCTPEIERLFRNVASTCISTQRQDLQEGVPAMP
ncbi:unnamed protein product, partial [Mesorhabditis belari]|uniref:CCR4-NOT transcription complex subunit 1 n=1 Tax=Mesorhabditis belari TaxID=2138241 RepID=A0AAF3E8D7_9BILA